MKKTTEHKIGNICVSLIFLFSIIGEISTIRFIEKTLNIFDINIPNILSQSIPIILMIFNIGLIIYANKWLETEKEIDKKRKNMDWKNRGY